MSIIVLTHNGKLPKDGGLRWGYQVGNTVIPILGAPYTVLPAKPVQTALPKLRQPYYMLARCWYRSGECVECGEIPRTPNVISMQTDEGMQKVLRCGSCGEHMKPHPSIT